MWIVVCIPLMVFGVIIAVTPVLAGSIHHHRRDRAHGGPGRGGWGRGRPAWGCPS